MKILSLASVPAVLVALVLIGPGGRHQHQHPLLRMQHQVASDLALVQAGERIAFRVERNKVILPVLVNDSRQLDVILDTGMPYDGLLLYRSELAESIGVDSLVEAQVGGAGEGSAANALVARSASFSVGGVSCDDSRWRRASVCPPLTDGVEGCAGRSDNGP